MSYQPKEMTFLSDYLIHYTKGKYREMVWETLTEEQLQKLIKRKQNQGWQVEVKEKLQKT